jgi:hypothetical protein
MEAVAIGHNAPPSLIEELRAQLAIEAAPLVKRRDELLAGADRAPAEVTTEDAAGKTGDLIKLLTACHKAAETLRVGAKEPHLEAGRAVDGFFGKITKPLADAKSALEFRLNVYLGRKAQEGRRKAEEEARVARAQAQLLEAEALARELAAKPSAPAAPILEAAVAQEAKAIAAEAVAAAKPAELSRTRGDYGSMASLRTVWVGEITDRKTLDLEKLRQHLPLDGLERAVNAFVKAGGRDLPGAKIYEKSTAVVR